MLIKIKVGQSPEELKKEIEEHIKKISESKLKEIKALPVIKSYLDLFKKYNLSTDVMPNNYSLFKRALEENKIKSINNLVDIINLASLQSMLSISVHDFEKIDEYVAVRTANSKEIFIGVNKKKYILKGGELVASDKSRIIDLGISSSSCEETKIEEKTGLALILLYVPKEINLEYAIATRNKIEEILNIYTDFNILTKGEVIS